MCSGVGNQVARRILPLAISVEDRSDSKPWSPTTTSPQECSPKNPEVDKNAGAQYPHFSGYVRLRDSLEQIDDYINSPFLILGINHYPSKPLFMSQILG